MRPLIKGFGLLLSGIALLLLLQHLLRDKPDNQRLHAILLSNTLTQSLDGHRRYLTVKLPDSSVLRLTVKPDNDCQPPAQVLLAKGTNALTEQPSYHFIECQKP
ncbi:TPA: hypothetical protein RQJ80_000479 [Vibrio vulnificus]|uniref:hypothetical protein n=1 Tax=Vibrio vulnificus TaxID=672 RepID=UPI0019D46D9D|nr:hypothetical protein [Vibrio vulnificus]EJT0551681.1 hypothetical protein [Vibrio vulnificus]MBN8081860.1 hypothetical protein [Vibrio vulnificus]MBN8124913.1 hypothetical protein [Vibrio vulnificus]MBN8131348.1 hypothetical protein [Vibrio vulnificus]MBN8135556.1 hypothetical protein [Vibrio vulnificus]